MLVVESNPPAADISGRGRILREARLLFTAQGYAAVSMQQIADAAVVNKATLYHHFRDKEDLFLSVMVQEFARLAASVGSVIACRLVSVMPGTISSTNRPCGVTSITARLV